LSKKIKIIYCLIFSFLLFLFIFKQLFFPKIIKFSNQNLLSEGDLIFLKGNTIRSKLLYGFTTNENYSHVGIAIFLENKLYIVHANPDKRSNSRDAVINESLDEFIENAFASMLVVLRLKEPNQTLLNNITKYVRYHLNNHTPFDHKFLLATDDYIYCTELIFKAFKSAGIDITNGKLDYVDTPIVKGYVVLPETIINSNHFYSILSLSN
jgi:hypothetical protein